MNRDESLSSRSRRRAPRDTERNSRESRRDTPFASQPLDQPAATSQNSSNGRSLHRVRSKRRKLESDDKREGLRRFGYGQYGQVVPGMLKMEIASCDGGIFEPEGELSWPDNILRNDSSVYCTKSDRCNLILRHREATPFCLKKIVIRAPKTGFDAPYVP